jgi:inner membrane protein
MLYRQEQTNLDGFDLLSRSSRARYRRLLLPTRYAEARLDSRSGLLGRSRPRRYRLPLLHPLRRFLGPSRFHAFASLRCTFGTIVVFLAFRRAIRDLGRFALWAYFFLATASHGLLDGMTDGGLGVVFFSPFNNTRYFLPWRPIRVSPIGVTHFFSHRGLEVVQSELLWIWLPATMLVFSAWLIRHRAKPST